MYNWVEYRDNYSKTSGGLWQYYRDNPDNTPMTNCESFKSKVKITGSSLAAGNAKDAEIAVPLKYLSKF